MDLDGEIKVPVAGPMKKKTLAIAVIGAAGVVGIIWWRRTHGSSSSAAAVDPNAADSAVTPTDGSFSLGPDTTAGDPFGTGGVPVDAGGGSGGTVGSIPTSTGFTTNAEWAQQAEADLGGSANVAAAINKVLGGVTVTTAQKEIFEQAVGLEGQPPQPYPPIHTTDTPGHPQKPVKKYAVANGHEDLFAFAAAHGLSESELVHLNPGLSHLVGTKKPIPKGRRVRIK